MGVLEAVGVIDGGRPGVAPGGIAGSMGFEALEAGIVAGVFAGGDAGWEPLLGAAGGVIGVEVRAPLIAGTLGSAGGATGAAEPAAAFVALAAVGGTADSASPPHATTPSSVATSVPPTTRMKSRRPSDLSDLSIVISPS
jgi:hypothetical protein